PQRGWTARCSTCTRVRSSRRSTASRRRQNCLRRAPSQNRAWAAKLGAFAPAPSLPLLLLLLLLPFLHVWPLAAGCRPLRRSLPRRLLSALVPQSLSEERGYPVRRFRQ